MRKTEVRIPDEVIALATSARPSTTVLELGCGMGDFSRYLARQGLWVSGVDFSARTVARARKKAAGHALQPDFFVGDVKGLHLFTMPFDLALDAGCFQRLRPLERESYALELERLVKPGGTLLIWGTEPPDAIARTFGKRFALVRHKATRRRALKSSWYWLTRLSAGC
jgi:SAM-dependent methyltransferase